MLINEILLNSNKFITFSSYKKIVATGDQSVRLSVTDDVLHIYYHTTIALRPESMYNVIRCPCKQNTRTCMLSYWNTQITTNAFVFHKESSEKHQVRMVYVLTWKEKGKTLASADQTKTRILIK